MILVKRWIIATRDGPFKAADETLLANIRQTVLNSTLHRVLLKAQAVGCLSGFGFVGFAGLGGTHERREGKAYRE